VIKKLCLALACLGGLFLAAPQGASALPVPTAAGLATVPDSSLVTVRYRRHWRRHHRHRWHRHHHHRRWHHHRRHRHWHHRHHRHHWRHHRPLRFSLGHHPGRAHAAAPWRDPIRRSSTSGSLTPRLD
jgi:hypothetical protein